MSGVRIPLPAPVQFLPSSQNRYSADSQTFWLFVLYSGIMYNERGGANLPGLRPLFPEERPLWCYGIKLNLGFDQESVFTENDSLSHQPGCGSQAITCRNTAAWHNPGLPVGIRPVPDSLHWRGAR